MLVTILGVPKECVLQVNSVSHIKLSFQGFAASILICRMLLLSRLKAWKSEVGRRNFQL